VPLAEQIGAADLEHAGRALLILGHSLLDLVEILDDLFAALEVEIAELRQRELASGSLKQANA
jgi:hypothetical protein